MRTVRSSSRLLGGVYISACWDTHTPGPGPGHPPPGRHPRSYTPRPPVDRILDTHLWKHYVSATSFADGKNDTATMLEFQVVCEFKISRIPFAFGPAIVCQRIIIRQIWQKSVEWLNVNSATVFHTFPKSGEW